MSLCKLQQIFTPGLWAQKRYLWPIMRICWSEEACHQNIINWNIVSVSISSSSTPSWSRMMDWLVSPNSLSFILLRLTELMDSILPVPGESLHYVNMNKCYLYKMYLISSFMRVFNSFSLVTLAINFLCSSIPWVFKILDKISTPLFTWTPLKTLSRSKTSVLGSLFFSLGAESFPVAEFREFSWWGQRSLPKAGYKLAFSSTRKTTLKNASISPSSFTTVFLRSLSLSFSLYMSTCRNCAIYESYSYFLKPLL